MTFMLQVGTFNQNEYNIRITISMYIEKDVVFY